MRTPTAIPSGPSSGTAGKNHSSLSLSPKGIYLYALKSAAWGLGFSFINTCLNQSIILLRHQGTWQTPPLPSPLALSKLRASSWKEPIHMPVPQHLYNSEGMDPSDFLALRSKGAYICKAHSTVANKEAILNWIFTWGSEEREQATMPISQSFPKRDPSEYLKSCCILFRLLIYHASRGWLHSSLETRESGWHSTAFSL